MSLKTKSVPPKVARLYAARTEFSTAFAYIMCSSVFSYVLYHIVRNALHNTTEEFQPVVQLDVVEYFLYFFISIFCLRFIYGLITYWDILFLRRNDLHSAHNRCQCKKATGTMLLIMGNINREDVYGSRERFEIPCQKCGKLVFSCHVDKEIPIDYYVDME